MKILAKYRATTNTNYPEEDVIVVGFVPLTEYPHHGTFRIVCVNTYGNFFLALPTEIKVRNIPKVFSTLLI